MRDDEASSDSHIFAATYVGEVKVDRKFKNVVGIDVGTTYSGTSSVPPMNPVKINCGAPSAKNARDECKVPTALLKCADGTWLFGNDALEEYKELLDGCRDEIREICSDESATQVLKRKGVALYQHYKMQLKGKTSGAESLQADSTMGGQPHSLMDLMVKTLEFLSKFALDEIQGGFMAAHNVTKKDILWVLTVPAIWNDFGKAFMRKAASKAGLIEEESSDHLLFALEPEAAAIAVHSEGKSHGIFNENSSFLMLDIGGGTADFTVHHVSSSKPLVLDEVARPDGGPWGGVFVDHEFECLLKRLFGREKYDKLKFYYPVEIAEIMEEFRQRKEDFDPAKKSKQSTQISVGGLFSDGIADALGIPSLFDLVTKYNEKYQRKAPFDLTKARVKTQIKEQFKLTLSGDQMMDFFEPTLSKICACVQKILNEHPQISVMAIVGGYGSSKVVRHRIREKFGGEPFNKTVLVPNSTIRPQAAIVHGAAYFGLYTSVIGTRVLKYTYGVQTSRRWSEACGFPESEAEWDTRLQEKRVRKVFSRIVPKGTSVPPFKRFAAKKDYSPIHEDQTTVSFPVFRSDQYNPKLTTDSGLEEIGIIEVPCSDVTDRFDVAFTFGPEIRVDVIRQDGEIRSTTLKLRSV